MQIPARVSGQTTNGANRNRAEALAIQATSEENVAAEIWLAATVGVAAMMVAGLAALSYLF